VAPVVQTLHTCLLRGSQIFPGVELCDESPDYALYGLADIWKGNYHEEPVCIKAIQTQDMTCLREVRRVCGPSTLLEAYSVRSIPDLLL
jgi:hypothetical protein